MPTRSKRTRVADDVHVSTEVAGLTPTARQEFAHRQLVERLESQIEKLSAQVAVQQSELNEQLKLKVAHETLLNSHRSARWIGAVCVVAMTVGGALVSTFDATHVGFGLGWGLIAIACVVQLGKSAFDW